MSKLNRSLLAAAALVAAFGTVQAQPIPSAVSTSNGSLFDTDALTGFQTTGANMAGSIVTVFFSGGASDSAVWTTTGAASGSASSALWSLSLNGDSFSTPWQLRNIDSSTIIGFSFNGVPGNTVFDIINGADTSPGSANGNPFGSVDGPATISFANGAYTNILSVAGVFYGDLYTLLNVRFDGGLRPNGVVTFIADTDNADARGIRPGVPEPQTYALMLAGLGVVGYMVRRRRA